MKKPHFGAIDFFESVMLIDFGLVDFDETYPSYTKRIRKWEEEWKAAEAVHYAKAEGSKIIIEMDEKIYCIDFTISRSDLLSAVALLINLRIPQSIDIAEDIILNLFQPSEFTITT